MINRRNNHCKSLFQNQIVKSDGSRDGAWSAGLPNNANWLEVVYHTITTAWGECIDVRLQQNFESAACLDYGLKGCAKAIGRGNIYGEAGHCQYESSLERG